MESTKHPDQNPEKAVSPEQEENSQQENAVNTVEEETSLLIENAVAETETEVTAASETETVEVQSELEPVEVNSQIEEIAYPVVLAKPEDVTEPEVPVSVEEVVEPEVPVSTEEVVEPEAAAEVPVEPEVKAEVDTEPEPLAETETIVQQEASKVEDVAAEVKVVSKPVVDKVTDEADTADEAIDDEVEAAETGEPDLGHMDREKLVALLEETVHNEDVNEIKSKVSQIKVAYLAITNKENQEKYQNAADSEEAESFETTDPLEERFTAAFAIYKHNKSRFAEDQEKIKITNLGSGKNSAGRNTEKNLRRV